MRDLFRRVADTGFGLLEQAKLLYRDERPNQTTEFIRVGPAASAEAELLSGHQLMAALLEMNRRFIETTPTGPQLTKHISLREIHPLQLRELRENGTATFKVDELWFDLDHPAHYDRRIVSVGVSIPCVTGPMTGVGGTLTLLRSRLRPKKGDPLTDHPLRGVKSIALSSGRDDTGRFELRPDDPLYHPFEGMGAVSEWTLSLPSTLRKFNYRTISDVVLTIRYTAESDGLSRERQWIDEFKKLTQFGSNAVRLMSLRHDRADAWAAYLATGKVRVPAPVEMLPHVLRSFPKIALKLVDGNAQPIYKGKPADTGDMKDATVQGGDLVIDDLGVTDRKGLDDVEIWAEFSVTVGA